MTDDVTGAATGATTGAPAEDATTRALIEEATKKSAIAWLSPVPDRQPWYAAKPRPLAAWLLWHEGSAYFLHGPGEQPDFGVGVATKAHVAVRSKETWGRIVTWVATVATVAPRTPEWEAVIPLLLGKRLNLPDGEAAAQRWAEANAVTRLTPTGELVESPGNLPADREDGPPPPTPATTYTRLPFTVGTATTKRPRPRRRGRSARDHDLPS